MKTETKAEPSGDPAEPARSCPLCPRLVAYRGQNAAENPGWWNGPAPSFGDPDARLLIVGLAPGRTGANRTGRPFSGDYAGILLYGSLQRLGLASGAYDPNGDDDLRLAGVMITNAVRCAPPENKPTPTEIAQCRPHLSARIASLPKLRAILALGAIAHGSVLKVEGVCLVQAPFRHGETYHAPSGRTLTASYHCSRYNTQTGRLSEAMFLAALQSAWAAACAE